MRIDPTRPTSLEPRDTKAPTKAAPASSEGAAVVKLSEAASTATTEADMTARVAHIRALIRAGEYPVDLDMLASRIVDDELLRVGRA